jgi:glycosyltransferase involved in cell wall biosynthesis
MRLALVLPQPLNAATGGTIYDRRVVEALRAQGVGARLVGLEGGWPFPDADDLAAARNLLAALDENCEEDCIIIDGLALGAMPPEILAPLRTRPVALVHHPLCLETGLRPADAMRLRASEQAALDVCAGVIVTSNMTAELVRDLFGDRAICIAEPGVDAVARAQAGQGPAHILAVGALSPRKAYDVLFDALRGLEGDWRLTIAGAGADNDYNQALRARAQRFAPGRVVFAGALTRARLEELYASAHIFAHPAHFEGFGMAIAEAVAHGLPIVASEAALAAGAARGAGVLKTKTGDANALRSALRRVIADPALRQSLADKSWSAAQSQWRWSDAAQKIYAKLRQWRLGHESA